MYKMQENKSKKPVTAFNIQMIFDKSKNIKDQKYKYVKMKYVINE